jgi:hypothetical protein
MKTLFIESVGLAAPGLENWAAALPMLRGESPYVPTELGAFQPTLLPPNERRRATPAVRLAFRVAEEAIKGTAAPAELAAVFATSEADTTILHRLCTTLAEPQRALSPTDFHNSVHNAAAGYWSIATGAKRPSTSISAYDATFVAGLIEAAALVAEEGIPVLLAAYDVLPPEPLHGARPIETSCGVALVLSRESRADALAQLRLTPTRDAETVMDARSDGSALEELRRSNPAARALPLLQLLAQDEPGAIVLAGVGDQRWKLELRPCP